MPQTDKQTNWPYIGVEDPFVDVTKLSFTNLVQERDVFRGEVSSQHRAIVVPTMLHCSILLSVYNVDQCRCEYM